MAFTGTTAKVLTGSATNSLGTLSRSVFNSTIGMYPDKELLDNINKGQKKVLDVLKGMGSSIETCDKKFDYEAFNGRNKIDDIYTILSNLKIENSSDFMNKNREFMKRLMRLNAKERDITLNALGVNISGESNTVSNEYVRDYEHVQGNNYYEDYVKELGEVQRRGDETTMMQLESTHHFNYSGIHNDLYASSMNLYPDEENKGHFGNKWITDNRNGLLRKTKKLFDAQKINTIISRFHTDPKAKPSLLDNARTKYGLSHGRNLLKKDAEVGYNSSYVNGYDNPYCRVWTHHHQYDRYYKTIRPFSTVDNNGNYSGTISPEEFHQWDKFEQLNEGDDSNTWGWKKKSNNGWQYSVMDRKSGMLNITPKYITGGSSNIHTKQCMFSIENLAWRGYDPYSFEQALSWEQRGPLGGRIMWFPPYGISFNETTNTQWESNTFLGRGEDVYTYKNTTRSGTLNFMMVVDHPSIINYISWGQQGKEVTDTDMLRFLAGCGDGLKDKAMPTPLTDEFTQQKVSDEDRPKKVVPKKTEEAQPDQTKSLDKKFSFYVFYPNNYSGTYDDPENGEGYKLSEGKSTVEAIPYLLAGKGAQKSKGEAGNKNNPFANDIEINGDSSDASFGNGYEMNSNGLGKDDSNCIIGATNKFVNGNGSKIWGGINSVNANTEYEVDKTSKKWYYRIDGRYVYPTDKKEQNMHYYNQRLIKLDANKKWIQDNEGYVDNNANRSKFLNKDIDAVVEALYGDDNPNKENEAPTLFTLAEVAYVLYDGKAIQKKCLTKDDKRIKYLKELLSEENIKNIESIEGVGYASKAGYVELNQALSKHRAETATNWFAKLTKTTVVPKVVSNDIEEDKNNKENAKYNDYLTIGSTNTLNAKKWRCAKVTVTFSSTETKSATEADTTNSSTAEIKMFETGERVKVLQRALGIEITGNFMSETADAVKKFQEKNGIVPARGQVDDATIDALGIRTELENSVANETENNGGHSYIGYAKTEDKPYKDENGIEHEVYVGGGGEKWYKDTDVNGDAVFKSINKKHYVSEEDSQPIERFGNGKADYNTYRYDQEYYFFKKLEQTDPTVFQSLMDKIQYFDPAFHSMTPEGFNGRLTFLQQCMRQGNTVSASDGKFAKNANNLAFGRAPYCVLRLGDFYNQMIVIDSLSISYDPLVWDLNVEGVGVQPLLAHVTLNFKFVGGGDMTGPVRRLQNAMSFNYYANARLYDNRADRVERKWSDKTNGAIEHDEILGSDLTKSVNAYGGLTNYGKTYTKNIDNINGGISQFYTTDMYR